MDKYSKIILTIIMILLFAILIKPGLVPNVKAGPGITFDLLNIISKISKK